LSLQEGHETVALEEGRMFIVGAIQGPISHYFYLIMDKKLGLGRSRGTIIKKILTDQIIGSPLFAFIFFEASGILEGQSPKSSFEEFARKFPTVYMVDWCVWPAAQCINFYFLPTKLRVVYVAAITLLWTSFLSWFKHRDARLQEGLREQSVYYKEISQTEENKTSRSVQLGNVNTSVD
ncbi:unnamed protein product, partial [Owenia fusiformis]